MQGQVPLLYAQHYKCARHLLAAHRAASAIAAMSRVAAFSPRTVSWRARIFEFHLCSRVVAFDVGDRLWGGRRPQDGHMMEMSYRCCCAAAGMDSPTPKPRARVLGGCSVDEVRHAATDRVRLVVVRTTVMTGASAVCCRHVGTASAVLRARLTCRTSENNTMDLAVSVRLWSVVKVTISNQPPRGSRLGPVYGVGFLKPGSK